MTDSQDNLVCEPATPIYMLLDTYNTLILLTSSCLPNSTKLHVPSTAESLIMITGYHQQIVTQREHAPQEKGHLVGK